MRVALPVPPVGRDDRMALLCSLAAALLPLATSTIVVDGKSPMGFNTFDSYPVSERETAQFPADCDEDIRSHAQCRSAWLCR